MIGTVRKNLRFIPDEMRMIGNRSMIFDTMSKIKLVCCCTLPRKINQSCFHQLCTSRLKLPTHKRFVCPVAIEYYNKTKGGVDTEDEQIVNTM